MTTKELNSLEAQFLEMVGWKVYVSQEECLECWQRVSSLAGAAELARCEFPLNSAAGQGHACDRSGNEKAHAGDTTANDSSLRSSLDIHEKMDGPKGPTDERSTPKMTLQSGRLTKRSPVKPARRCRVKTMKKECALKLLARQETFGGRPSLDLGCSIECSKQRLSIIVVP